MVKSLPAAETGCRWKIGRVKHHQKERWSELNLTKEKLNRAELLPLQTDYIELDLCSDTI